MYISQTKAGTHFNYPANMLTYKKYEKKSFSIFLNFIEFYKLVYPIYSILSLLNKGNMSYLLDLFFLKLYNVLFITLLRII